jgi:uncharacterized protein (TIGR03083 family)
MATHSPWPVIHAQRTALADDLAGLTEEQWRTPSLCAGWTVHDALGHMTSTAKITPPKFFAKLAAAGFSFHRFTTRGIAAETAGGPAATLAEFRRVIDATDAPPGPIDAMLGEAIIHGEDIRRPLGIAHTYPVDSVTRTLDFFKNSNLLIGAKKRIAGLRLEATDAGWATGEGPVVKGPALSLLLAMTGRRVALDDLSGDGVAVLRDRD